MDENNANHEEASTALVALQADLESLADQKNMKVIELQEIKDSDQVNLTAVFY